MRLLAIILVFLQYTEPVQAIVFCANGRPAIPFRSMVKYLGTRYKEIPTHLGTTGREALVQFGNKKTRTITMVTITVEGLSCIVLAADNWEFNSNPAQTLDPVF